MSKDFTPRPFQKPAISHLVKNKRCALWMDMGMGKSASVLSALEHLNLVEDVYPALIVAPLRVARDTWPEETQKWNIFNHIKISPIVGELHERMSALHLKTKIFSINFEQIPWLVKLYGSKWPFKTIIVDEATRLAGFRIRQGTQRSKELYKVAWPYCNRLWELTGGPAPGGLQSLYGQIMFLDQGQRLGRTFTSFEQRWFQRSWDGFGLTPLPHAQEEIQDKLADICLSIRAEDWFDLRKPIVNTVFIDLPPTARKLYKDMERDFFAVIEKEDVEAPNAAAKRNKCMQFSDGAVYTGENRSEWKEVHSEKIKALESIVEEANGMPLLVAYHFRSDLTRLLKAFPKGADISTTEGMKKFKAGKALLGFAHPASMGHGIDGLQDVTNRMVYFSHNDNLDNHNQILGRIGPVRQMQSGYDRPVFVTHIVARDTVEEYAVLPNLQGKGELQDLLMKAMRARK